MGYARGDGLVLVNGIDDINPNGPFSNGHFNTSEGQVSFFLVLSAPAESGVPLVLTANLSAAASAYPPGKTPLEVGDGFAAAQVVLRDNQGNDILKPLACMATYYDCGHPSTVDQRYEFDVDLSGTGGFRTFLLFNGRKEKPVGEATQPLVIRR